jgi:hypothetical protein
MKHRLRRAPLTTEDERIFCRLGTEVFFSGALSHAHFMHSMDSDRRDADLMLEARTRLGPGPMCIESADCNGEFIDCCGAVLGSHLWHAPVST